MKTAATPAAAATTPSRVVSSSSRVVSLPGGASSLLLLFIIIFSSLSSSSKANHVRAPAGEDAVDAAASAAGLPPILPGFGSLIARKATGNDGGGGGSGGGGGGAEVRGDAGPRAGEDDVGAGAADSDLPPVLPGFGSASRVAGGGSSGSSSSNNGSGGGTNVMVGDDTMLPGMQQQQRERNGSSPSSAKAVVPPTTTPQRWIALVLTLDEGATNKIVRVKEDGTEEEVYAAVTKGCREAGVTDTYQASIVTAKWMTRQLGWQRTEWWFERSGAKDVFQRFFGGMAAAAESRPFFALEMGSLEGASAMWFAKHLLKHPASLLVCLDTWDGGPDLEDYDIDMPSVEERFKWNMGKAANGERVVAMRGDSLQSLAGLVARGLSSSFDAIYVDASHQMKDVLADSVLSFRLLKVGGVMIFDDYATFPGVEQATRPLEEALGDSLEVLFRRELLVVKKTAEDRWATRDSTLLMGNQGKLDDMKVTSAAASAAATASAS